MNPRNLIGKSFLSTAGFLLQSGCLQQPCSFEEERSSLCERKSCRPGNKTVRDQREDIFLETKLWPAFYEQADAVEKTLKRLDTDYIDLLLIHQPSGNYIAGYQLMEKACKEGKVRAYRPLKLYAGTDS